MAPITIGPIFIAQACQLTALVVAVAVASRLMARNRPHLAHALWLVVLLKCVTPPVWSSPTGIFCWLRSTPAESAPVVEHVTSDSSVVQISAAGNIEFALDQTSSLVPPPDAEPPGPRSQISGSPSDRSVESEYSLAPISIERRLSLGTGVLALWILGSLLIGAIAGLRLLGCLRHLRRCGVRRDAQLDKRLTRLRQQLRVRRSVRLLVSNSRLGPAVLGFFRPTILLPECIVAGRSADELEPLLAHELIHVRRGDLGVGILQVLAQAVWWFHPLVWFAGRRLSREAERCCDEEVIGSLKCDPARYARSLLDVLELKQLLVAVPAVPGVRPVELTAQRLERIMSLGQGCRHRASWWCWVMLLGMASIALPGGALVGADSDPAPRLAERESPEAADDSQWATKTYAAADLLDSYQQQTGLSDVDARRCLLSQLELALKLDAQFANCARGYWVQSAGQSESVQRLRDNGQAAKRPVANVDHPAFDSENEPALDWLGSSIRVRCAPGNQPRVAKALDDLRHCDFGREIELTVRWAACDAKLIDSLSPGWKLLSSAAVHTADSWDEEIPAGKTQATYRIERNLPVKYALLDQGATESGLNRLQAESQTTVLQAPRFRFASGQTTTIEDARYTPFVVDLHELPDGGQEPVIRVYSEGTALRVRGARTGDVVRLDYDLVFSAIGEVEIAEISSGPGKEPITLQVPEVARVHLRSSIDLPLGKTLVIAGLKKFDGQRKAQPAAVMLTVNEPPAAEAQSGRLMLGEGENSNAGLVGHIVPDAAKPDEPVVKAASDTDDTFTVAEIRIEGNATLSAQKITPQIKTCGGKPLDKQMVEQDVRQLMKTHRFVSVDPQYETQDDGRVVVIFRVVERPTIRYVRIFGSGTSEKTLAKKAGLKVGDPLDEATVEEARGRLEKYLRSKVFAAATVAIVEGNKPGDTGVRFMINEGEKFKVWRTVFEGNTVVPAARLQTELRWQRTVHYETTTGASADADNIGRMVHEGLVPNEWALDSGGKIVTPEDSTDGPIPAGKEPIMFLYKGKIDQDRSNDDARRLTEYYRGLGFFRARVGREFINDDPQKGMTLKFFIDEGPRYVVTKFSLVGCKSFAAEDLVDVLQLKEGDFFDQRRLDNDIAALQAKYGAARHTPPQISSETRFLEEPGKLELVYKVTEADPVTPNAELPQAENDGFGFSIGMNVGKNRPAGSWRAPISLSFKGQVDEDRVTTQINNLTAYYRSLGFLKARVVSDAPLPQRGGLFVSFTVDAGERYVVTRVSFIGCHSLAAEELGKDLQLKVGDFFNQKAFDKDIEAVKERYRAAGLATPAISPELRFPDEPGKLELVYKVAEEQPGLLEATSTESTPRY
jgi:beta-lactamase regulating signal transducer with metallopeptidase domain/outer membrane translocation and assembly module TamA